MQKMKNQHDLTVNNGCVNLKNEEMIILSLIKLKGVSKFYYNKNSIASGFNKINLELNMGEFVVITGESGSGKSTLLNVISGLDSYEEGEMYINGEETSHYTEQDYELYRRKYIGNIFQHFNLVNSYTVYQNIELVLLFNGYTKKDAKGKINEIIKTVGLTKYKNTKVSKLSGGQKQRVALARALAKDTPIIVADEPTGNLDIASAKTVMKLLHDISINKLVVIVTHNYEQVEPYATRKISMSDGKIVEDKIIKKSESLGVVEGTYKSISFRNKVRLGIRNVFNIKVKFLLLFFVYLFLTIAMFSEYSSIKKQNFDQDEMGYNYYFNDTRPERIILNKKDKKEFDESDFKTINSINLIKDIFKDDLFLDTQFSIYKDETYFYGTAKTIRDIKSVDEGRMPENDKEVVLGVYGDNFSYKQAKDTLFEKKFNIENSMSGKKIDYPMSICGVKYLESRDNYYSDEVILYVPESFFEKARIDVNASFSIMELTLNNHILSTNKNISFQLKPNDKVKSGEAIIFQDLNSYCNNYYCNNTNMNLKVSNIYYEESLNLKVKRYTTKENFRSLTGLSNYDDNVWTIFISNEDYLRLFDKPTYQISVFVKDTKDLDDAIAMLESKGYNTLPIKKTLTNNFGEFIGVIRIIRNLVFIVATIALFFIVYFIIKIILKSRNIYYSTIRILGSTKQQAKTLLNIELLFDANIAYIVFLGLILIVKKGLIDIDYIKDMVVYFKYYDYILLYLILSIMSLLISNRYAHKLFKNSVMHTYREEV